MKTPGTSVALLLLVLTQVPFGINESLKFACILTTSTDYASFWKWEDIPLDSRVRFCNGASLYDLHEDADTNDDIESTSTS